MDPEYGYFHPNETRCKSGAAGDIRPELRGVLNQLRKLYGEPIYVTSGYRSPRYNLKVGGKPNSYHLKGLAADLALPSDPLSRDRLLKCTFEFDFGGRGFYRTFIHVDLRQLLTAKRAYWVG